MSNGYGNYRTSREESMAAYDAAPPPLRWIMRNAVAKWAAKPLVRKYWGHRMEGLDHAAAMAAVAAMVRQDEIRDTRKDYGPTHPEARPAMHEAAA